jgi:acyl-CoA synthetase (AMP-forming)/AMP-acid ligase II
MLLHALASLHTGDATCSPGALRNGAAAWSAAFHEAGIRAGDRVVCALPNSVALAQVIVAALHSGITLAPAAPRDDAVELLHTLDARVAIAAQALPPYVVAPAVHGGPPDAPLAARPSAMSTPGIPFLLRSSGTSGTPRWIALSATGVGAVLASHASALALPGRVVLSVLPWHHAFGLILDLLPALSTSCDIVLMPDTSRDVHAMIQRAQRHGVDHLSMVPLTAQQLACTDAGLALLQGLRGGLVGGAPISSALAPVLRQTQLRVGYGQTEASPGIMLTEPGECAAGILGRPVGCEVRIDADDVLTFRGPNVCAGHWKDGAFHALPSHRWQRTDDLVELRSGAYYFTGRATATFKLANGRMINAMRVEQAIQDAVPRIAEVMVLPQHGDGLCIRYSTLGVPVSDDEIRSAVPSALRAMVLTVVRVDVESWVRTAKGELDRRAFHVRAV